MIEGILSTYSIGDYVSANCTSGKSNPLANLTWYINGVKLGQQVSSEKLIFRMKSKIFRNVPVGIMENFLSFIFYFTIYKIFLNFGM